MSNYLLSSAKQEGASLFPSGLLMYDLPSARRTASRPSINPEPEPSVSPTISSCSSSPSPIDDEANRKLLTSSEDWWSQAIEPQRTEATLTMSMFDGDFSNFSSRQFNNLSQKILVENRRLSSLNENYSNKAIDHVYQWYEQESVPNLIVLMRRGLIKVGKEKSIRIPSINKKKQIVGQLDQHGKILSSFDDRRFDSIEDFYRAYQPMRKQKKTLQEIYQQVHWFDQTFHTILVNYAESIMKVSGMQTRLIDDDEILMDNRSVETITKEILCQISCWNDGINEIDLE